MSDALIELNAVSVHVDESAEALLQGVNWRIARGDFWVVGGAPESGKTSLLATAASLNRPGAGTLRVFGRDLAEASEEEQVEWRRRMGYVFDNGGRLLSRLTVAQNVALPLYYHSDEVDDPQVSERVERLLSRMELTAFAQAKPSGLGLRLQQRASLARALALPTDVLFLDDALTGLGPREARWWTEALRQLQRDNTTEGKPLTIAATCDDFRPWLDLATHFAVIEEDRFRVIGGREQVLASTEPSVRELL